LEALAVVVLSVVHEAVLLLVPSLLEVVHVVEVVLTAAMVVDTSVDIDKISISCFSIYIVKRLFRVSA
jgi:hypothetical protein